MLVSLAHVSAIDSHQPLCNDFDAEIASLGDGLALQVDPLLSPQRLKDQGGMSGGDEKSWGKWARFAKCHLSESLLLVD